MNDCSYPLFKEHLPVAGTCVIGLQWGDEAKGKLVDLLTSRHEIVVRYQGGANAGHTVIVGDTEFVFHMIPSGIMHEDKACVVGNGVVIDPEAMLAEIDERIRHGNNSW